MGLTRLLGEQDEYISVQLEGAGGEAINDDEIWNFNEVPDGELKCWMSLNRVRTMEWKLLETVQERRDWYGIP